LQENGGGDSQKTIWRQESGHAFALSQRKEGVEGGRTDKVRGGAHAQGRKRKARKTQPGSTLVREGAKLLKGGQGRRGGEAKLGDSKKGLKQFPLRERKCSLTKDQGKDGPGKIQTKQGLGEKFMCVQGKTLNGTQEVRDHKKKSLDKIGGEQKTEQSFVLATFKTPYKKTHRVSRRKAGED